MPKRQEKKRKDSKITRREALKLGLMTSGVTLLTSTKSFRTHFLEAKVCANGSAEDGVDRPINSPPTRPFLQRLPIPPIAVPQPGLNPAPSRKANMAGGEALRAEHQRWDDFPQKVLYKIHQKAGLHQFHPQLPPTPVWGYDGIVPGPTILAQQGVPALVRFYNNLPADHKGWGIPETTIHLHNAHTASESDGFAADFFMPGQFKDNLYLNTPAGIDAFPETKGDPREARHTLWFHDHRVDFTAHNTYKGLAALYLIFDDKDTGVEKDLRPGALQLPAGYGQFDIPLILSDKLFNPDGSLFGGIPGSAPPLGDKFCVNGVIQPYLPVFRRKYRFRLLNTGPSRIWTFTLSDQRPFIIIATDGNLLPSPLPMNMLTVNVAERFDFILDFSKAQLGDKIYLQNTQAMFVRGGTEPVALPPNIANLVMRFDVVGDCPDDSRIPETLCELPPIELNKIAGTRIWNFDLENGIFLVNNRIFDETRCDAQVQKGTAERWILRNKLPHSRWVHPVHIHCEEFQILSFNGVRPPPHQRGRKDVIALSGGDEAEIFMWFRDFTGKYLIHCHNLAHEDDFMMVRWDIVDQPLPQPAATFIPHEKRIL